jgi:hypothetical protein
MPSEAARQQIEWAKRRLRRRHPTGWPVRVLWVPPHVLRVEHDCPTHGDADFLGDCGLIRLSHNASQEAAVETLLHEWAHLLRHLLPIGRNRMAHDGMFWTIYGGLLDDWHGE